MQVVRPLVVPEQLRTFLAVAQSLSFTAAAATLGLGQPTVSQHIHELEELLHVKLFDRTRRTVALTPAGENLLRHGQQIFQLLEEAENAVHTQSDPYSGRLAIGCASTTLLYQMPNVLVDYARKYPNVDLKIMGGTIREVAAEIWSGALDLALVVLPLNAPGLRKIDVCDEPFTAVLPAAHPVAKRGRFSIEDLATEIDDDSLV